MCRADQDKRELLPHEKGQVTKVCGARWRHPESWFKGDKLTQCPTHDPVRLKQQRRTQRAFGDWRIRAASIYGGSFNKLQIHVTFPICATVCSVSKSWTHTYKHISKKTTKSLDVRWFLTDQVKRGMEGPKKPSSTDKILKTNNQHLPVHSQDSLVGDQGLLTVGGGVTCGVQGSLPPLAN